MLFMVQSPMIKPQKPLIYILADFMMKNMPFNDYNLKN